MSPMCAWTAPTHFSPLFQKLGVSNPSKLCDKRILFWRDNFGASIQPEARQLTPKTYVLHCIYLQFIESH